MNNFEVEIKAWNSRKVATAEINEYIIECSNKGIAVEIMDISISKDDEYRTTYIFTFKLTAI